MREDHVKLTQIVSEIYQGDVYASTLAVKTEQAAATVRGRTAPRSGTGLLSPANASAAGASARWRVVRIARRVLDDLTSETI